MLCLLAQRAAGRALAWFPRRKSGYASAIFITVGRGLIALPLLASVLRRDECINVATPLCRQ